MKREQAAAIGQEALIWLAGQPEALAAFLAASGLVPEDVRARTADPEFLGFVLDFVLASDATVLEFARAAGVAPEVPARARAVLGGAVPNWT
jgi:uncharacterized protein DUF3572